MSATQAASYSPIRHAGIVQLGNYTSLQNAVLAINSIFLILSIVAVGLRFWSRRLNKVGVMVNDIFAAISLMVLLGFFALETYGICIGMGRRIQDLKNPQEQMMHISKLMVPLPILWSTINTLVKISVLDLYLRVFPVKSLRLIAYSLITAASLYWLIGLLFAFLNCRPFSFTWDKTQTGHQGHCVDDQGGTLGFGIVNLVLDIAVILLPMPFLYTLHLRLSKRISLIGIFALGFVITAVSALRIKIIVGASSGGFSYSTGQIALWSFIEVSCSIINGCLPTIQPALIKMYKGVAGPFSQLRSNGSHSHKFSDLTATTNSSPAPSRNATPAFGRRTSTELRANPEHGWHSAPYMAQEEKQPMVHVTEGGQSCAASKALPPLPKYDGYDVV